MLTKDDVFPMYKACKDSKDQGGFHDFVEILKLYDKNDDNTMLAHELFRLLTNLGEKLIKDSCLSSPSLRECVLLRSKCSPPSTKYKNIYKKIAIMRSGGPPLISTHQYSLMIFSFSCPTSWDTRSKESVSQNIPENIVINIKSITALHKKAVTQAKIFIL